MQVWEQNLAKHRLDSENVGLKLKHRPNRPAGLLRDTIYRPAYIMVSRLHIFAGC